MSVKLNSNDIYVVGGVVLEAQTEKAWLISLLCDFRGEPTVSQVWLPKSQSTVTGDKLILKGWLLLRKIEEVAPSKLALSVTPYEKFSFCSSGCSEELSWAEDEEDEEIDWRDLGDDIY